MHSKSKRISRYQMIALAGAISCLPVTASADAYSDSYERLCDKMKTCAMAEMGEQEGLSDDMKAMIKTQLDSMCQSIEVGFATAVIYRDLISSAAECMDSMSSMSCETLMSGENDKTPQCVAFREKAKAYE